MDQAVTSLNQTKLNGRSIKAERSKLKEQVLSKSANSVVVTNLSYSVKEDKLKVYLESAYGVTSSVSLAVDDKGRSKGFAFVHFADADGCKKALEAREFKLEGRVALVK
mmetsp:Transcript_42625/g.56265  ORF Transcript_42625/g.56265 Transcript_42625/m.56265 type:complete len:109 (+) Transcript_42625:780-1106(+)|eukprot:CAMPEP_0185599888 /NCGR_PEP_ID=MMETSP0434-20130131/83010_1 /TAXON_ID=626734 ORGANISM="Favella taraikaensis, Strain Fe Narragansett Bay" /NCGR_SAMPLE_ID=MMETSP0434 /ASSEMBLY_ACC=CAM_ASM_000379 /LENGTH=108 /DNA_ID=CAMNT_0028229451 /DNA_START=2009 /DNA_END=2335 /DNA_ORIENTATION=-